MIDFNFQNENPPERGSLLISEPFLVDRYFSRSVIYLCDHNQSGSFGFVLNNYVETGLKEMIEDFPDVEVRVSIGGPVDTSNLFFIHSLGDEIENSALISDGLYMGGNFQSVREILEKDQKKIDCFRFFIGYSGWESKQLESELDEKSWVVLNQTPQALILNTQKDDLWTELMSKMGGKFKVMSTFPKNPSDN